MNRKDEWRQVAPDAWRSYSEPPNPVVYRIYDKGERLIYIGATRALPGRLHIHQQQSWWFGLVAEITTEDHPTMEAAFAAEMVAIQEEQPAFNSRHTTNGPVLTVDDAELAHRWRQQPGRYLQSWTLIDRVNAVRAANVPTSAAA